MKATRPTALHAARATSTATALALCAVLAYAAPASADAGTVLAMGRNVDGLCVFDDPIVVTSSARADADCRLVSVDDVQDDLNTSAPATVRPKVMETYATPSGGGIGIEPISLQETEDLAGAATRLAGDAVSAASDGWRYYEARAQWSFFNERNERIYHDSIAFTFRRDAQGGMISGVAMTDGTCQTGLVSTPHRPAIESCTWEPGIMGGSTFSFTSKGTYADYMLLGVRYDWRRLGMMFTAYQDGTYQPDCSPLGDLPVGWHTTGCKISQRRIA